MPTVALSTPPVLQFFDNNGVPLVGGQLLTFVGSVPYPTYVEPTGMTANSNPIILNSRGEVATATGQSCGLYLQINTAYTFTLLDSVSNIMWAGLTVEQIQTELTQQSIGQALYPQSLTEIANGIVPVNYGYPEGNVLRYGLLPNDNGAGQNNSTFLQQLLNPSQTGFVGNLIFPNTTGADTYFFADLILIRDNIHIDLCGCIASLTKSAPTGNESNSGLFHAIRDFSLTNGEINVDFTTGGGQGTGLFLGGRGTDGPWPGGLFDSTMLEPMGNIAISDLKITTNNPAGHCITALGGLQNVTFTNVWMDGTTVGDGFYYEFGWATDAGGILANRQTSHAHNLKFTNIKATNLTTVATAGIECNGAYNVSIDGLYVNTAASVCSFGFGESYFYNPWLAVDDGKVTKRTVTIRNVVGKAIKGSGIIIQGAGNGLQTYLAATLAALSPPAIYIAKTDLASAIIDGFVMNGSSGSGAGIYSIGATRIDIRNGRLSAFGQGILASTETTHGNVENVDILDTESFGMQIGQLVDAWVPGRSSIWEITKCFIAGSGTTAAAAAISLVQTQSVKIRSCRFGHLPAYDGITETTQLQAVTVGATGFGVDIDGCTVQATSASAPAYSLASALSSSRGCRIRNANGVVTTTGLWLTDFQSATAATIAGSGTITGAGLSSVRITMAGDITGVIMDAGSWPNQDRTIVNESSHSCTFAASGTSNVADGTGDVIAATRAARFTWDTGTSLWYRG